MIPMARLPLLAILSVLLSAASYAKDPFSLSGVVTNSTNASKPSRASATFSFDAQGSCVLRIEAPLYGSGPCEVKQMAEATRILTILSTGPSGQITWTGAVTDAGWEGSYSVEYASFPQLPEHGTFALKLDQTPAAIWLTDVLTTAEFTSDGKVYHILSERNLAYILDKTFSYIGIRLFLDDKQNPIVRIEDHKDGSLFIDAKSNQTLMEWHTDGKDGYFSKASGAVTSYYDRFMNATPWSSVAVDGQTIYAKENGDSVELYDTSLKPLNIRSAKTSSGKVYWTRGYENGLTEYFDDSMNSLKWYSAVRNGETYYAHVNGKKVKVYDANFQPVRRKSGFWSNFGRGLAAGLAAYGQALQAQAAAANQTTTYSPPDTSYDSNTQQIGNIGYSNTTGSDGSYYNTLTQRIGNIDFSTTTGSNGYYASTTKQQIGNFGYLSGYSSNGSISGTTQQIGSFNYSNYTTPGGQWNGTSQHIGNFTYHTITGPDGSVHTGATQRIGDFLYTTIE